MASHKLHPDILEFISSLLRMEKILLEYEEDFWAEHIKRVRRIAENSDGACIERFLSLFGGMGGFGDLVLQAPKPVNEIFYRERTHSYKLAQALL